MRAPVDGEREKREEFPEMREYSTAAWLEPVWSASVARRYARGAVGTVSSA